MSATVGRRPFAQVLRNSLSGHPPPTGCDTLTQVHTPCFPPDLFLTQDFKSGFQKIKSGKPMPDFIFHPRYITHSKTTPYTHSVVIHSVKLKILKANHNYSASLHSAAPVVIHSVKLKILKANHNSVGLPMTCWYVVIHSVKLKILKANHNSKRMRIWLRFVVIHSVKLKILKANHNS